MVFHGPEKIGKTTLAANAKKPVVLMSRGETGLETLIDHDQLPPVSHLPELKTWTELLEAIEALWSHKHDFQTVVLDTLNGFEEMLYDHVCETEYGGDRGPRGFLSYMQGYQTATPHWKQLLRGLDKLREEKDMSVIGLCHTLVKPFKNPAGQDYDQYTPQMHPRQWGSLHQCADLIGFINTVVVVDEDGNRAKGKGGTERFMYCEGSAAWIAGNRLGMTKFSLGPDGKQGWKNLVKHLNERKKK